MKNFSDYSVRKNTLGSCIHPQEILISGTGKSGTRDPAFEKTFPSSLHR